MNNLFEKASRSRLRFDTTKGQITVEDLWVLSLPHIDEVAKSLQKKIREEASEQSFISQRSSGNEDLETKFEIVKYVISVRLKETEDKKVRAEKEQYLRMLKDLKNDKKIKELESLSLEDIDKKIAELEK
jgi:hypothetical protein